MSVPAPEKACQPTIRDHRWQRRAGMTFVLHGYVFIDLHENSGRQAT